MIMRGSRPCSNDSGSTANITYLYAFRAVQAQSINIKVKRCNENAVPPLHVSVIYGCLMSLKSLLFVSPKKHKPHKMRNQTHKSPSHNPIVAHAHTSLYGCLVPINSIRCPGEIQIRESGGSRRSMRGNEDIVMWGGGHWDQMEFELHEAGRFLNVGVVKERRIMSATRIA
jgi:hypothetical protein